MAPFKVEVDWMFNGVDMTYKLVHTLYEPI